MATDGEVIRFRGLQGRTLADQERALQAGFESTQDYAIDELARMLLKALERIDRLEQQLAMLERHTTTHWVDRAV